ncbi:hypothetical protein P4S60_18770 [Pseudoalteromonas sp. Hal040]|uniref:hypothetical protein n=1 Tax=unclassified Pseudoalteromonas TaxID=194690 RepID=UPI00301D5796
MFKETERLNELLTGLETGESIDPEAPLSSLGDWINQFEKELEFDSEFIELLTDKLNELESNPENLVKLISSTINCQLQTIVESNNNTPEFEQLLQLFKDVNSICPKRVEILIHKSGILSSSDKQLENYSFTAQLEGLNGEQLVKKIITITPSLIEDSYKRYLYFLVTCKYTLDSKDKAPSNKIGVMLDQITSLKLKYPLLIDSDIIWIRNATAHRSWEYIVETGMVRMTDNKDIAHFFSPNGLMEKVMKPFLISSKVFYDASLYYKLNLMNSRIKKALKMLSSTTTN